jgi:hypothetical protein
MLILRIARTKFAFERIDVVQFELSFPDCVNAVHHVNKPPPRLHIYLAQKSGPLPIGKDGVFWSRLPIPDYRNSSCGRYLSNENITTDPTCASRVLRKWFSFLYDLANKEVLRDNDQVSHNKMR